MHWYNNIVVFMQKCIVHNKISLEISILKKLQLAFLKKYCCQCYNHNALMILPHKTTVF